MSNFQHLTDKQVSAALAAVVRAMIAREMFSGTERLQRLRSLLANIETGESPNLQSAPVAITA